MQVDEVPAVIYSDEAIEIRSLPRGVLDVVRKTRFGHREAMGPVGALSLWSHELGSVLATEDRRQSILLSGDARPLLERGVVDRRHRWANIIQMFTELINGKSLLVPFFTADDSFDLQEALSAVWLHFFRERDDGGFTAKVRPSHIPSFHPYKYEFQGQGWLDVLSGFWGGGDLKEFESEDAFKESRRRYLMDVLGVKALVLQGVQNIELCDHGVSFNFVSAIDDAVDLVKGWGMQCAVSGTSEAWWALRAENNGPSKHMFRRVHIPADKVLTAAFMRTMQFTFSSHVQLAPEVLQRVYEIAGGEKDRALTLMEHLVGVSYNRDRCMIDMKDVESFCGDSVRLVPAEADV